MDTLAVQRYLRWHRFLLRFIPQTEGRDAATREDFDELVRQVKATTEATKAIEARISDEVWSKQRLWEMKREALLGFLYTSEDLDHLLIHLATSIAQKEKCGEDNEFIVAAKTKVLTEWTGVLKQQIYKRVEVSVVCGADTHQAAKDVQKAYLEGFKQLNAGVAPEAVAKSISTSRRPFEAAMRRELGIPAIDGNPQDSPNTPQFTLTGGSHLKSHQLGCPTSRF